MTQADHQRAEQLLGGSAFRELSKRFGRDVVTVAVIIRETADLIGLSLGPPLPEDRALFDAVNAAYARH